MDGNGAEVVSYVYDSWGKLVSTSGTLKDTVGAKNPYRYRGYRYDTETGLYYLNSRYYNPEWGRFINADALGGRAGTLLSHNMFAYALNNPVNMDDLSGHFPKWLTGALTIVSGVTQVIAGAALGATVGWTGIGAVAAGFLLANGSAAVLSGVAQVANSTLNTSFHEENIIRTASKAIGKAVGGNTGQKVSATIYDVADMASSAYSVVGGGATALSKTANALGRTTSITKETFTLFSKPSIFTNKYAVKSGLELTKYIDLPRSWFRAANGVGAGVDSILSGKRAYDGLISIFGGGN